MLEVIDPESNNSEEQHSSYHTADNDILTIASSITARTTIITVARRKQAGS